jgi:hypothetical protein
MENIYIIKEAECLLKLLNKNISEYKNTDIIKLKDKWNDNVSELYDIKFKFLYMGYIKTSSFIDNYFIKSYYENYKDMRIDFNNYTLENDNIDNNILMDNEIINYKKKSLLKLIIFIFQYLCTFKDKSINDNLWNYCLKSKNISIKLTIIGLFTIICQYLMIFAVVYSIINEFNPSKNIIIILITIISTIISILYSYNNITSFINSIPLYKFLLHVYKDYPTLSHNKKKITIDSKNTIINRNIIKFNLSCDFLSNFILPLIVPIINVFIIINSESIIDGILNSVAICFIIQIDEELYTQSDHEKNLMELNFTKWILSNIYCYYFSEYNNYFINDSRSWKDLLKRPSNINYNDFQVINII